MIDLRHQLFHHFCQFLTILYPLRNLRNKLHTQIKAYVFAIFFIKKGYNPELVYQIGLPNILIIMKYASF